MRGYALMINSMWVLFWSCRNCGEWCLIHEMMPLGRGQKPSFGSLSHEVMQTRNNYGLGFMNGATGVVTHERRGSSPIVEFDGTPEELYVGSQNLQDLQTAYALTIHKSKGSEFPNANVAAHKTRAFLSRCNFVYHGVTRARETAVAVEGRWGLRHCARKHHFGKRKTPLSICLTEAAENGTLQG